MSSDGHEMSTGGHEMSSDGHDVSVYVSLNGKSKSNCAAVLARFFFWRSLYISSRRIAAAIRSFSLSVSGLSMSNSCSLILSAMRSCSFASFWASRYSWSRSLSSARHGIRYTSILSGCGWIASILFRYALGKKQN